MRSIAFRRLWKRLPEPWRDRFWRTVHSVRKASLRVRAARARRPSRIRAAASVTVVGLFRDTRGVAQAARLLADALEQSGVMVSRIDAGEALGMQPILPPLSEQRPEPGGAIVTCLNPPELARWLDVAGAAHLRGRWHIGYWAWELPDAPASWRPAVDMVDEIWCHSDFAAAAIRKLARGRVAVATLMLPVFAIGRPRADRRRFDLPADACIVLAAMDLRSSAARKNPVGALQAFLRAWPTAGEGRALLVCKISGLDAPTEAAQVIREAAARRPDVRLLAELLSDTDMRSLTASADIVLSLHRAEGFGLMAAEAAWMGKAVITTGWSAPAEFLHREGACLVDWRLTPIDDPQGQYGADGGVWAEPDLEKAAQCLRRLVDASERERVEARALSHAEATFSPEAWARRARRLLGARLAGGSAAADAAG